MNRFRFLLVGLISLLLLVSPLLGQPASPKTLSANKKFSAEIDDQIRPNLTVFKQDGEQGVIFWSKPLVHRSQADDPDDVPLIQAHAVEPLVFDDGLSVILRFRYSGSEETVLRMLTRQGIDKSFSLEDIALAADNGMEEDFELVRQGVSLDILLNSPKPLYAFWVCEAEQWLTVDFVTQQLRKPSPALVKELDTAALVKARELARKHQPDPLRKALAPIQQQAAKILPGVVPDVEREGRFDGQSEAAFRFLASKKNPEDKPSIEELLRDTLYATSGGGMHGMRIGLDSRQRELGDELLARWEGKIKPNDEDDFDGSWNKKLHYTGRISGTAFLPFAAPEKAGALWLYLIPAGVPKGEWPKSPGVLNTWTSLDRLSAFPGRFPGMSSRSDQATVDRIQFNFGPLSPGEYRLKAVWDRRPPFADEGPRAVGLPQPGDYESTESPTIKVTAGTNITGLALLCTNQVGIAREYYAADAIWKAGNPPDFDQDLEPDFRNARFEDKTLFTAPVQQWVLSTNSNESQIEINRIRLVESFRIHTGQPERALAIRFFTRKRPNRNEHVWFEAKLIDDHGCTFASHGAMSSGRAFEPSFSVIPHGSKEFKLVLIEQDLNRGFSRSSSEKVAASFSLKNLLQTKPQEWKPESLPTKRDLDLVTIELQKIDPGAHQINLGSVGALSAYAQASPPGFPGFGAVRPAAQNNLQFHSKHQPPANWYHLAGSYQDRWGNQSTTLAAFCKRETIFKFSVFCARELQPDGFLPNEKWEVPLQQIPGAGQSLTLGMTNEIQGQTLRLFALSGTGEFTYRKGRLIAATNQASGRAMAFPQRNFGNLGRSIEPKLYIKDGLIHPMAFTNPYQNRNLPIVIVSKIPHLACYLPDAGQETIIGLLEQDTSIPEAAQASMQGHGGFPRSRGLESPVKYLPLDFRAGETGKKLTFLVQKARKAEFIIEVPQEARARDE